jgi:uncharacterized protein YegL
MGVGMPKFQENFDISDTEYEVVKSIAEYHVACVFLIDTSGSMISDNAIGQVNQAVEDFRLDVTDTHDKACIDVALISFGPDVKVLKTFGPVGDMQQQYFSADGGTPMGEALNEAMDMIMKRKALYKKKSTPYYRPWIFCVTDGEPTDEYLTAAQRLKRMVAQDGVVDWCVGVDNFNRQKMREIFSAERIYFLRDSNFRALFKWLSASFSSMSQRGVPSGGSLVLSSPP